MLMTEGEAKGVCSNPDCSVYPMYGVAPHECYWRKPGGFEANPLGTSTIIDVEKWPANFLAEIDPDKDIAEQLSWGLCGIWTCPDCGSGVTPSADLWTAQQVADGLAGKPDQ